MTGIGTYTSNLLYHSNQLFKKKETKNYSDSDGGSLEDILICCDDGRSFRYSKILFTFFLQIYCGFSKLNISEDSDVIIVSFYDIGSLMYLINLFYTIHHDESCQLCKYALSISEHVSAGNEDKNIMAAHASEVLEMENGIDGCGGLAYTEKPTDVSLRNRVTGELGAVPGS